jgi:hypothetical protein
MTVFRPAGLPMFSVVRTSGNESAVKPAIGRVCSGRLLDFPQLMSRREIMLLWRSRIHDISRAEFISESLASPEERSRCISETFFKAAGDGRTAERQRFSVSESSSSLYRERRRFSTDLPIFRYVEHRSATPCSRTLC